MNALLTLPIQPNRLYLRRDGVVIRTKEWGSEGCPHLDANADGEDLLSAVVFRDTGRVYSTKQEQSCDLIADVARCACSGEPEASAVPLFDAMGLDPLRNFPSIRSEA